MNEDRVAALIGVAPGTSVARRWATQTENMSDETFHEFVVFKRIDKIDNDVEWMVARLLQQGKTTSTIAGIKIEKGDLPISWWVRDIVKAMIDQGCQDGITIEDVTEYYRRREEALAMAPKGKAVRYPK